MDLDHKEIRSKDRVKELGEVFTPPEFINHMLDLLPSMDDLILKKFLDPTCGTGNFLIETLKRKLNYICENLYEYKNSSLSALTTDLWDRYIK